MSGGIPTHCESGVATSLAHSSDGEARVTAPTGGSGEQLSGLPNVVRFNTATSNQRTFPDHVLDNPEQFYDDAPYIPPRLSQAELPTYPAPDPRMSSVYDPTNHTNVQQHYPFEGGTSPAESHHSIESTWSTSSSSTSSQQIPHNYDLEPTSQFSQISRPPHVATNSQHYPAYRGKHRLGFEHAHYGEQAMNIGVSYYRTPGYPAGVLLAPEEYDDTSAQADVPPQMAYASTSSRSCIPPSNCLQTISSLVNDSAPSIFADTAAYLRQQLGLSAHESVSLRSLPDPPPGEKPSTPLPMLVKLAIYGSPNRQLTLQEIYTELENRFQWFRDHKHERAWKNSIRHNLSLNKVFVHVPRPITEPGKGSYWRLDVSGGEGYKRTRKRRPKNKVVVSEEEEDGSEMDDDRPSPLDMPQSVGSSRSSGLSTDDTNIDPELRSEGHVVGEGRTRSSTRRVGGSPYPQQSPRYQQGQLPVVTGQDAGAPGQPSIRFGQPSFNFPTYSQTRPMPLASVPPTALFAPPSTTMAATTPMAARSQLQDPTSYDRAIPQLGIEYVGDNRALPAIQPVTTYSESREPPQGNNLRSSSESSSSGSSRTWRGPRSVS